MSAPAPRSAPQPAPGLAPSHPRGTMRLGSIAGSDVLVSSSWLVIAAVIAVVVAPRVDEARPGLGGWTYVVGVVVAVVLYLAVLLHEVSHVLVVRRYGHEVPSITLSFMGGRTAVDGEAGTPSEEFFSAVVGPIASLVIGGVALAVSSLTPDGVTGVVVEALAFSNLGLGVMNLVPVMPLDGGRVLKAAVWGLTGSMTRGVVAAAWCGRLSAAALVLYAVALAPVLGHTLDVLNLVVLGVVAVFLWTASSAELSGVRLRMRFSTVVARDLARRTLAVAPDLPLAEAVRQARDSEAGAIVTVDSYGATLGVVHEAALRALPDERRPWVATSSVTRTVDSRMVLPRDITGDQLLAAISQAPAPEYVLVRSDGSIFGVLVLSDVDRAVGWAG